MKRVENKKKTYKELLAGITKAQVTQRDESVWVIGES